MTNMMLLFAAVMTAAPSTGLFPPDVRTVGIVSISSIIPKEKFVVGTNLISKAGYKLKVAPNVEGPEVSPAETRARLFEQAWLDPEIDILLFSRGGTGAEDVVPLIDWEKLRKRDMRVVGFSDVTMLLNTMLAKGVGHPYSGPSLSSFGSWNDSSCEWFARVLAGDALKPVKTIPLKPGTARSLPMGGHVTRMHALFKNGTTPRAAGRIVFLECTARHVAAMVKADLLEMRDGGFFSDAAAVVFADFRHKGEERRVIREFIGEFAQTLPCPVFKGYPYGHIPGSLLIDFRREASISPDGVVSWCNTTTNTTKKGTVQ